MRTTATTSGETPTGECVCDSVRASRLTHISVDSMMLLLTVRSLLFCPRDQVTATAIVNALPGRIAPAAATASASAAASDVRVMLTH